MEFVSRNKKFTGKMLKISQMNEKELKKLAGTFAGIQNIIQSSIFTAQHKVAPKLVYDAASRRGFNDYTGAMAYAYGAVIVTNGQVAGTVKLNDGELKNTQAPPGTIRTSKNGKRFANIQTSETTSGHASGVRHGSPYIKVQKSYVRSHKRGRKTQTYYIKKRRYIKRHEFIRTLQGSFHKGGAAFNVKSRVERINPVGNNNAKSYIQLFNASTYAAMVQAKGYNVLGNAYVRGRGKYARHLMVTVTDEILKKAMHNYRKDVRSQKQNAATGRLVYYGGDD